jgi:hypothetical protein
MSERNERQRRRTTMRATILDGAALAGVWPMSGWPVSTRESSLS